MNLQDYVNVIAQWVKEHGLNTTLIVVLAVVAWKLAALLNRRVVAMVFRGKTDVDSQKLAQTVTSAGHWLLSVLIALTAAGFVLAQMGIQTQSMLDRAVNWLLSNGLGIVLVIAITFVALKAAGIVSTRLIAFLQRDKQDLEFQKRADTLGSVIRWVLRTGILAIATVMILGQLGVQIGPILAAAGVVGLAVGFGAQNLVQDIISGFFILLEDQVRVGDVVQLNDKSGLVEKITLRMTILRDYAGNVHYVRNGKIDVVTNMTKEYSNAVFDVGVAYREDVDEVSRVLQSVGEELQQDPAFKDEILAPLEIAGLDKFADSAVMLKARIKTRPSQQWRVMREFNRRLKRKFDDLQIEIPFPHVTVYPGQDRKGDAPFLRVRVDASGQAPKA